MKKITVLALFSIVLFLIRCDSSTFPTIGGKVSGLDGTLVLQNNSEEKLTIKKNGSFTFADPVAFHAAYNITVKKQPSKQKCVVSNGKGSTASDISNVTVVCTDKSIIPGSPGAPDSITELRAGQFHNCLLSEGKVKCWGYNSAGQLGIGDGADRGDNTGEMGNNLAFIDFGTGRTVKNIGVGLLSNCAILDNDSLKCWGYNINGQLGLEDNVFRGDGPGEMGDALTAINLGTGRNAEVISVGYSSCSILDNGDLKCWGFNGGGYLGRGDTSDYGNMVNQMGDNLSPVDLGTGRTVKTISAGTFSSCAILDNDTVKCWGDNGFGQLGLGDAVDRGDDVGEMGDSLPVANLGTGRTAKAVSVGRSHACAILDNDTVKCWGYNGLGQLGIGDTANRGDEVNEMGDSLPVVNLGTGRTAKKIVSGRNFNCAFLDNDTVKCWGENVFGQLGLGDTTNRGSMGGQMGDSLAAVDLGTGRTAKAVTSGDYHACALLDDDSVKCWGFNNFGQLGLGDTDSRGDGPGEMGDSLPATAL